MENTEETFEGWASNKDEEKPAGALKGMRILDLSAVIAGPFATHFLVDQGAQVIKIEAPAGDISRNAGMGHEAGMSPIFQQINRGKHSIVLDLKQPKDRERLLVLAKDADAVVCNTRPKAMQRLGLSYEDLRAVNPSIVYASVTGYGSNGPYAGLPAYDDLIQGMAGVCDLMSRYCGDGIPRYVPMTMADRIAGMYAAISLLTALLSRQRSGEGCHVEIPMFESLTHFVMVEHLFEQSFEPATGPSISPRVVHPSRRPYQTADGFLCVLPYTDQNWRDLLEMVGRPEWILDPRFADFASRMQNPEPLNQVMCEALMQGTTASWMERLRAANIAAMPMHAIGDIPSDPHLQAAEMFVQVPMVGHAFNAVRSPFLWNGKPLPVTGTAPHLGQRSKDVGQAFPPAPEPVHSAELGSAPHEPV